MKDKIKKILAIDDSEANLLVLKTLLFSDFPTIKFLSATSGRQGLLLCRQQNPDVVLLDIVMPGLNGYEVCKTLKSDKLYKYIPVIMFTAELTDPECRIKALECGADAFLTKPVDESELKAQIRAMLRLKDAEDRKKNEQKRLKEMVNQRTRDLEIELRQRKRAEKELKIAFDELERRRKTESALFDELKAQMQVRREAEFALMQSRKSFQNYFENCSVGMSVTSPEKTWLEVNQSLCRMLGYSKEELSGLTWVDLTYPEDIEENIEKFTEMSEGRLDRYDIDKRFVRKDGSLLYISLSVVCERNSDGSLHHLLASYVDITERKRAEERLRQQTDAMEAAIEGMAILNPDGNYIYINKSHAEIYGYNNASELIGASWRILYDIDELKRFDMEIMPKLNQNGYYQGSIIGKKKDGSTFPQEISLTALENGGLICTVRDITERKQSEERVRLLSRAIDQSPATVIITNKQGNIEYANPKFTELTGYSFNEVLGENPRILKSGLTSSSEYADMWKTILAGGEWHGEFKNKKKSGEEYFEDALISPIKDENGNITHFLAVKEDITGKKKDKILIRKLNIAIEQSPVSTIITDAKGNIEFVNTAFTTMTQYTIEEVVNKTPRIFNHGHIPEADFEFMWENLKAGKIWKSEYQNRRKDRSVYWEDVIISSLMNRKGEISNYILIMDDISEKKKMLNDLVSAKEIAEESNRLKSAFLATMNHELRTPLNHILGFSEMILKGVAPEENVSYASGIQSSGQSLLSMIEGIFDLALVEHANIQLRKQTFSLIDQFMENKASFDNILTTSAKHEQIQLIFKPDTRWLSSYVTADRSKINQVLTNLFKNAVKFTHSGTIEFGYKVENDSNLVFYIKDTGIGIPPEKQSIIFDFFRQGDDSFTRIYGGIGIGLAISQKIVKILNGQLKVVSEPGQGSTFYLSVPVELSEIKE